jgi:hypothetical protein
VNGDPSALLPAIQPNLGKIWRAHRSFDGLDELPALGRGANPLDLIAIIASILHLARILQVILIHKYF